MSRPIREVRDSRAGWAGVCNHQPTPLRENYYRVGDLRIPAHCGQRTPWRSMENFTRTRAGSASEANTLRLRSCDPILLRLLQNPVTPEAPLPFVGNSRSCLSQTRIFARGSWIFVKRHGRRVGLDVRNRTTPLKKTKPRDAPKMDASDGLTRRSSRFREYVLDELDFDNGSAT